MEIGASAGKDPITGKYKYLYKTVKGGPHIADQELARLVTKSKQLGTSTSITVERFLDEWMKAPATRNLAPGTIQGYANLISSHITPAIGSIKIKVLTARLRDELHEEMLGKRLSRSRIRHVHGTPSPAGLSLRSTTPTVLGKNAQ